MSITDKKIEKKLEWVSCIWYFVTFKNQTETLLDSRREVNVMSQTFTFQIGLKIQKANVGVQKINSTTLETYQIVVSTFSVLDKDGRKKFFKESFLLVDV